MPDTNVIAQEGQTLCELAIAAGFLNCQPIRDLGSNAGKSFLTGPLKAGDVVAIPAIRHVAELPRMLAIPSGATATETSSASGQSSRTASTTAAGRPQRHAASG